MDEKIKRIAEAVRFLGIYHDGKRYLLTGGTSKQQIYKAVVYIKALLHQDIEALRIEEENENREMHEKTQRIFNEVCDEMMPIQ